MKPEAIRKTSEMQRRELKKLVERLLDQAGGGASFQYATRAEKYDLSKYIGLGPDVIDRHMPLDVAADLTLDTGLPWLAEFFARLVGCRVVAGNDHAASAIDLAELSGLMAADHGVASELLDALADGHIDRNEAAAIIAALDHSDTLRRRLRGAATRVLEGGAA